MKPQTILIAEDDSYMRQLLSLIVVHKAKCRALEATTGVEALSLALVERPELVILDVKMPGQYDGYDVARRLKAEPATRQIPVLMLSALNMAHERQWGLSQGADEYLCKPIDPNELVARIEAHLKRRHPAEVLA